MWKIVSDARCKRLGDNPNQPHSAFGEECRTLDALQGPPCIPLSSNSLPLPCRPAYRYGGVNLRIGTAETGTRFISHLTVCFFYPNFDTNVPEFLGLGRKCGLGSFFGSSLWEGRKCKHTLKKPERRLDENIYTLRVTVVVPMVDDLHAEPTTSHSMFPKHRNRTMHQEIPVCFAALHSSVSNHDACLGQNAGHL